MASNESLFPSQQLAYDHAKIEEDIADLKDELRDEEKVATQLSGDSAAKMEDARTFLEDNQERIADQHSRIQELETRLRDVVQANSERVLADKEYHELVSSEEFETTARRLAEMRATIKALHKFLVDHGVRGRPGAKKKLQRVSKVQVDAPGVPEESPAVDAEPAEAPVEVPASASSGKRRRRRRKPSQQPVAVPEDEAPTAPEGDEEAASEHTEEDSADRDDDVDESPEEDESVASGASASSW